MTPEQKKEFEIFLFKKTPLWHLEDIENISAYFAEFMEQENRKLIEALSQSVEVIKQWHARSILMAGKLSTVVEDVWHTYYENAPELKGIREILKEK